MLTQGVWYGSTRCDSNPHEPMATSNLQDCKLTKLAMVMFLFALPSAQITYKMRVPDCTSLIACMGTANCIAATLATI